MMQSSTAAYAEYLRREEKSSATIEKYLRAAEEFLQYAGEEFGKQEVIGFKAHLKTRYAPAGANAVLAGVNSFLRFLGREECLVRTFRVQKQIFVSRTRELSRQEYQRLVSAAGRSRIGCVIQTLCATGIRVSELKFITAEAVRLGYAEVTCKNKTRVILIPARLGRLLKRYMKKTGITAGSIFVTRSGRPLDRSNIWKAMKALGRRAGVSEEKIFPHNLRHLFARTFYEAEKDIVRLADLMGHSSISTTRLYTMGSLQDSLPTLERVTKLLFTT